jgi:DNA mismatch repair ATPase MutS
MMNYTASALGRAKLKSWFAKPLRSREAIKDRLDAIEMLKSVMTKDLDETLRKALRGLSGVVKPLTDLKFRPSAKDLLSIAKTCRSVQDTRNSLLQVLSEEACANSAMLQALLDEGYDALKELEEEINRVLDDRAAGTSEIYTVRKFVAPHLDQLRENYQHLPDLLVSGTQNTFPLTPFLVCSRAGHCKRH